MSGPQGTAWAAQVACTPSAGFNTCVRVTYSGADQTFTVPVGVNSVNLKLWGAAGGNATGNWGGWTRGGAGSYATGTLGVSPGSVFTVIVGQGGIAGNTSATYGGGGAGGADNSTASYDGASGGGRSALRASAGAQDLITAGGGGGAASATATNSTNGNVNSYAGGGDQDAAYSAGCSAGPAATRGTTTSGGAGGSGGYPGGAGSAYQGGTGGQATVSGTGAGGGGGGGYFGGGAGQGQYLSNSFVCSSPDGNYGQEGSGAGGSSNAGGSITGYSFTSGNRDVVGNAADTQYVAGVGAPAAGVGAGTASGNGMVVIQYNRPIRLRLGKSLPSGRAAAGDQFALSISNGATVLASATTTGGTNAPTEQADYTVNTSATYTLSEAAAGTANLAYYTSSISCTNATGGSATTLPSGSGTSFTVTPAPGDDISCQITNTPKPPTISLQKALGTGGRIAASDQFSLSGTGTGAPAAKVTTGSAAAVTSTAYSFTATAGAAYTLNESMAAGSASTLAQYSQSVSCTNTGPTNVGGISSLPIGITPTAGDNISCTVTNTPRPAPVLTLQKVLGGSGRISGSDQFTLSASGPNAPAGVTTTGGGINVTSAPLSFTATSGSSYTLDEAMAGGSASALSAYTQWVSCSNAGGVTDVSGLTTLPVTVMPVAGDNITCAITNYPTTEPGGGSSPDPGAVPVCNADPVISGSSFLDTAWVRAGWDNNGTSYSSLQNKAATATQTQAITGVTPGALLKFRWNAGSGTSGGTSTLTASYGPAGAETVYWSVSVPAGSTTTASAASNGAICVSGCGSSAIANTNAVELRLPAGIPKNGTLKFTASGTGTGSPYIAIDTPISIRNTGICLAKTSVGGTGTFNFTTTGVDTNMGGGGTTASITTSAVNTPRYYDASATRTNNQPLLITSPGATANVTIGETPATGYVLESVSCPGLSPVRSGNSISIANVPRDTVTTCTFTNRAPIINLSKALSGNRLGAADQFSVAIRTGGVNGTVMSSTAAATTTGSGSAIDAGTGTTGDFYTVPGTTYTLTETGAGGANIANYKASLTCSDAAGVTPAASLPTNESFNPAIGRDIVAATGANLRCVITNSPGTPTVSGRVFLDNGQGSGTANDGILNGGEGPLAGVAMRLTNCAATVYATAQTDAAGGYSLGVPSSVASGSALCVEESNPGSRVSTGASVGSTALPSGAATAVSGISYTYTRTGTPDRIAFSWNGTGHANLNFGDVDNSTLAANGAKSGAPGNTVTYGHTFTAGTAGTVRFGIGTETPTPAGATGWSAQIFADPACTGSLQPGAAQLYPPAGAGAAVAAAGTACIVVRQFIPATASQGASNRLTVKADFDYANAGPALAGSFTVEDTTTVSSAALDLRKQVRNVTQAGSFGVTNQAKSGETLEYRISYTNNSDQPISSMQISDTTPAYTTFVSATTGTTPATLTSCTKNTPANAQPAAAVPCGNAQAAGGTGPIDWRFVGTIAPGGTGSVLFRVKVD